MSHGGADRQFRPAATGKFVPWPPPAAAPSHEQFFSVARKVRPAARPGTSLLATTRLQSTSGVLRARAPDLDPGYSRPLKQQPSLLVQMPRPSVDEVRPRPSLEAPRPRPSVDAPRARPSTEVPRPRPSADVPRPRPSVEVPRPHPSLDAPRARPLLSVPKPRMSWDLDLLTDDADYVSISDLEQSPTFLTDELAAPPAPRSGPEPLPDLPEGRRGPDDVSPMPIRNLFPTPPQAVKKKRGPKPPAPGEQRVKRKYTKRKHPQQQESLLAPLAATNGDIPHRREVCGTLHPKQKWSGNVDRYKNQLAKVNHKKRRRKEKLRIDGVSGQPPGATSMGTWHPADKRQTPMSPSKQDSHGVPQSDRSLLPEAAPKRRGTPPKQRKVSAGYSSDSAKTEEKPLFDNIDQEWALIKKSVENKSPKKAWAMKRESHVKRESQPKALKPSPVKSDGSSGGNRTLMIDASSDDDFGNDVNAPMQNLEKLQEQMIQSLMDGGAMSALKKKRLAHKKIILIKKRKKMSDYWRNKLNGVNKPSDVNKLSNGKISSAQMRVKRKYTVRPLTSENIKNMEEAIERVLAQTDGADDTANAPDTPDTPSSEPRPLLKLKVQKIQSICTSRSIYGPADAEAFSDRATDSNPVLDSRLAQASQSSITSKPASATKSAPVSRHAVSVKSETASVSMYPTETTINGRTQADGSISSKSAESNILKGNGVGSCPSNGAASSLESTPAMHAKVQQSRVVATPRPQTSSAPTPDPRMQQLKTDLTARMVADLRHQQDSAAGQPSLTPHTPVMVSATGTPQSASWPRIRLRHRRRRDGRPPRLVRMSEQAYTTGATFSQHAHMVEESGEGLPPPQQADLPRSIPTARLKTFLDSSRVSRYRGTCAAGLLATVELRDDPLQERLVFVSQTPMELCTENREGTAASNTTLQPDLSAASLFVLAPGVHSPDLSGLPMASPTVSPLATPSQVSSACSPMASLPQLVPPAAGWRVRSPLTAASPSGGFVLAAGPSQFSPPAPNSRQHSGDTSPVSVSDRSGAPSLAGSVAPSASASPRRSSASLTSFATSTHVEACLTSFLCNRCPARVPSLSEQIYHEIREHMTIGRQFRCLGCAMSVVLSPDPTEEVNGLLEHYLKHVDVNGRLFITDCLASSWACSLCGRQFDDPAVYGAHEVRCRLLAFSCMFCGNKFDTNDQVRWHEVDHLQGPDGKYACEQCPSKFPNKMQILGHRRFHFKTKNVECPKCGKKFMTTGMLSMHNRWKHSQGPCRFCGRLFTSATARQAHEEHMHLKYLSHMCDVCQFRVMSPSQLRVHKRSHMAETPHMCPDCDQTFYSRNLLRKHRAKHATPGAAESTPSSPMRNGDISTSDIAGVKEKSTVQTNASSTGGEATRHADGGSPIPAELRALFDRYKATWTGPSDSMTLSDLETSSDEEEKRDQEDIQAKEELYKKKDKNSFSIWSCPVCHAFFTKLWGVRAHILLKHPGASVSPILHEDKDTSALSKREFLKEIKRNAKTAKRELKMKAKRQAQIAAHGDNRPQRGRPRKYPIVEQKPPEPVDPNTPRKRGRPRKVVSTAGCVTIVSSASSSPAASKPMLESSQPPPEGTPTPSDTTVGLSRVAVSDASATPPQPSVPSPPAKQEPPLNCVEKRRWKCMCDELATSYDDLVTHTYIAHPDADLPRFEMVIEYIPKPSLSAKVSEHTGVEDKSGEATEGGDETQEAHDQALLDSARVRGPEKRRAHSTTKVPEGAEAAKRRKIHAVLSAASKTQSVGKTPTAGAKAAPAKTPSSTSKPLTPGEKAYSVKTPDTAKKVHSTRTRITSGTGSSSAKTGGRRSGVTEGGRRSGVTEDDAYKRTYKNSSRRFRGEVGGFAEPATTKDTEVELYCYCRSPYDEVSEMIGCDSDSCKHEWFHFECVGIVVAPKGKWFCPDCAEANKKKSTK